MATPVPTDTQIRLASMRQIHCAIEHLHRGDYECVITLAGAAEGMLPETWKPHFRQKVKAFSKSPEIQEQGGAVGENDYINWLKHGSLKRGGLRFETATISAEESLIVVYRAVTKYNAVYEDFSPQMLSYLSWLKVWLETGVNDR
ncbi:hypothetical protein JQ580_14400 [Bradyrhizobium japonicum]|uniref:hypothetical protein n=1 Tax=Bradyrhizobium japonicum TaxID=375 RepID=UPI001BAA5C07|nr:hypothetical protein [Bradyrhizobium japonicum]MBR0991900.1 hypothetical protein [Bradyrhizobium japonicum]